MSRPSSAWETRDNSDFFCVWPSLLASKSHGQGPDGLGTTSYPVQGNGWRRESTLTSAQATSPAVAHHIISCTKLRLSHIEATTRDTCLQVPLPCWERNACCACTLLGRVLLQVQHLPTPGAQTLVRRACSGRGPGAAAGDGRRRLIVQGAFPSPPGLRYFRIFFCFMPALERQAICAKRPRLLSVALVWQCSNQGAWVDLCLQLNQAEQRSDIP